MSSIPELTAAEEVGIVVVVGSCRIAAAAGHHNLGVGYDSLVQDSMTSQ